MARTVIVTGAGRGIGAATARKFLGLGDRVYGADLAFDEAPPGLVEAVCDIADPDAASGLAERAADETGRIDVLVNNAGIRVVADVVDTSVEDWDRLMSVNLRAVFLMCKFTLPRMLEQGSGAIVNVASNSGWYPIPNRAAYCASKAGVIGLTRQMALQYAGRGVRVTAVCPGNTLTPFTRGPMGFGRAADPAAAQAAQAERMPLGRSGEPEEIAAAIAYLASEDASFVIGSVLDVDGGSNLVSAHVAPGTY
jgi:NAD(P)-dependent dehydrogenase (short-subunit alcohol dehydrogenase family)